MPLFGRAGKALSAAVLLFLGVTAVFYFLSVQRTGGTFVYALDDPYIHLAIARNLCEHGMWGLSPDVFNSAASSIAWPIQLAAGMKLFGPQEWLPLALNLAWCVLALFAVWRILHNIEMSPKWMFFVLAVLVIFTSLPLLALLGMEHSMQVAVNLLFVWAAARILASSRQEKGQRKQHWWELLLLCVLAAGVTMTRYEGAFLIVAVVSVSILQRRWREAVLLPIFAAAPIVVFGAYAVANGSHWLPNPILVKSDLRNVHSFSDLVALLTQLKLGAFVELSVVLLPLAAALAGVAVDAFRNNKLPQFSRLFVLIVSLTAILHMFGARPGWFTRYEAYLVFLTLVACSLAWRPVLDGIRLPDFAAGQNSGRIAMACSLVLLLVFAAPFLHRLFVGLNRIPAASKNIHDQQIQMARFVKKYYHGQPIVINDLGAVVWYSGARPVDMAGLATLEVAQAVRRDDYSSALLTKLARTRGAKIALVYNTPYWMPEPRPPAGWIAVGSWTIGNNVVCGDKTVHFYAFDEQSVRHLTTNLRKFSPHLPRDVAQAGKYVNLSVAGR